MQPPDPAHPPPCERPCFDLADIKMPVSDAKCWYMDSNRIDAQLLKRCAMKHLTAQEFQAGESRPRKEDSIQHWCSRLALRYSLSRYTGSLRSPAQWQIKRIDSGKLVLADKDTLDLQLDFSITHTDGVVFCAVVKGYSIGIDAERADRQINPVAINSNTYSADELMMLWNAAPQPRSDLALQLWTLKEATSKSMGTGLATDFSTIEFRMGPSGQLRFASTSAEPTLQKRQLCQSLYQSRYLAVVTA